MKSKEQLGLIEKETFDHKEKLRADTGDKTQRPKATDKTIKDERGTFKNKC